MKGQIVLAGFGCAATLCVSLCGCGRASAQRSTEVQSDRNIELTVYKEDFAMVSESRPVDLPDGHRRLAIDDISKQLDPNSVLFDWPKGDQQPEVVATTYDLGVGNGESLVSRLNGQHVEMMWPSNDGKPGDTISGRLEAADQGGSFALRTEDKLYVNPGGTIVAPASATASTLPSLSVELESHRSEKTTMGLSYLTRGMSWSADYVAKLDPMADRAQVECWANVINKTGIPYPSAHIVLMTGSPNRSVLSGTMRRELAKAEPMGGADRFADSAKAPMDSDREHGVVVGAVGDIYAYKTPSTATIGPDQINRVSVLGTRSVPIKRDYAIRLAPLTYWTYENEASTQPHVPATLSISFVNDRDSNLGIPLPAGDMKFYDQDPDSHQRLVGAAAMGDTAKDEHVHLTLSNAFDVYAEYKIVKSTRIDKHTVQVTVQTLLHNEKQLPIELRVVQSLEGGWKATSDPDQGKRLDSGTIQWIVPMQPESAHKMIFTIEFKN